MDLKKLAIGNDLANTTPILNTTLSKSAKKWMEPVSYKTRRAVNPIKHRRWGTCIKLQAKYCIFVYLIIYIYSFRKNSLYFSTITAITQTRDFETYRRM